MDEQEKKEQERKDSGRISSKVKRWEFYVCYAMVIALIFVTNWRLRQEMELKMLLAEKDIMSEVESGWEDINKEIEKIPAQIAEERDCPFWNPKMEIVGLDRKAGTFRLAFQAMPKEYRDGMEGVFYVTCDNDDESLVLQGVIDENRMLRAETELPICGRVSATAIWKADGTEKTQVLDELDVAGEITPQFDGYSGSSIQFNRSTADFQASDTNVHVVYSDSLCRIGFLAGEGETEIQVNEKAVAAIPMEKESYDGKEWNYRYEGRSEAVRVEYGQRVSLVFKMKDSAGTEYSYLVEDGVMTEEGITSTEYVSREPAMGG